MKTVEERLIDIERQQKIQNANIDMVLNYCREIAKANLSAERIKEIERLAPNGVDHT